MTILCNNSKGDRDSNEDKYFTKKINENVEIFGIFDGHNGDNLSEFVCNYFFIKLKDFFKKYNYRNLYDKKKRIINKKKYIEEEIYNFNDDNTEVIEDIVNEIVDKAIGLKKSNIKKNFKIIEKEILVPEEEIYYDFNINKANELIKNLLQNLYNRCNHKIILNYEKLKGIKCGSTALVGIYFYKNLYVSNIGDTRLIIIDPNFKPIQITTDHNNKNISEKTRILSMGGYFNDKNYLFGRVNITRGFGDLWQLEKLYTTFYSNIPKLKDWKNYNINNFDDFNFFLNEYKINFFISYQPDIYMVENYNENIAIVTASDGIWSCMNNDNLNNSLYNSYLEYNYIDKNNKIEDSKEVFNQILLKNIKKKWNKRGKLIDNITYIIKFLNKLL